MAKVSKKLRALWDKERPHFGGDAPHRYEGVGKGRHYREECVYCGRPRDYVPSQENNPNPTIDS